MVVSPHFLVELFFLSSSLLFIKNREFSKEKEKAESRGDFQRLRQKKQMEEDLEGYMDWLTMAEEMGHVHSIQDGQKGLNVDVGKHKGDPVVMGLLKSTIFPLQQVLDGKAKCQMDIKIISDGEKNSVQRKTGSTIFSLFLYIHSR